MTDTMTDFLFYSLFYHIFVFFAQILTIQSEYKMGKGALI